MAVVTTSFLAAVEGDCGRPILARLSPLGHGSFSSVFDAQDSAERRFDPPCGQSRRLPTGIRWIGEHDVIIERRQPLGERERRIPMDSCELSGTEGINILFQGAETLRILFDEIGANGSAR